MKSCHILVVLLLSVSSLFSQFHISGNTHSLAYSWADQNETGQFNIYQGFQFNVTNEKWKSTSFSTYFREAYFAEPGEWNGKLYKLYITNSPFTNKLKLRVGRQFLYKGVVNGTIDGLCLKAELMKNLNMGLIVGSLAPLDRDMKVGNWDNGNLLGTYARYKYFKKHFLQISYVRKEKYTELAWHQVGMNINGFLKKSIFYYAKLDYNLASSYIQRLRLRSDYTLKKWTMGLEYALQRPMVYEFSYFNVFDIKAYNQVRSSLGYNWKSYLMQLNYIITTFDDENSHEMVFLISKRRNSVGIIYNNGFAGNNFGVYGQILYPVWKNLSLRLYGNYYNYERYMIDISEHATSFSLGIQYRMGNSYIRAEIQEAGNNLMKNDWRGFFQYIYSFNL